MDTFTDPEPTTPEPLPARDGREAPSRLRLLATSVAVAGLTATGGLAVILSTVATSGGGVANLSGTTAGQPQPTAPTTGATAPPTPTTATATSAGSASASSAPAATSAPATAQPQTNSAAQPLQGGRGPGHASSGGS